jgi:hypothetical protein
MGDHLEAGNSDLGLCRAGLNLATGSLGTYWRGGGCLALFGNTPLISGRLEEGETQCELLFEMRQWVKRLLFLL